MNGRLMKLCKVDRGGRPRKRKARLRHIHMQFFLDALAHPVDRDLDVGLDVARKGREELLLERPACAQSSKRIRPGIGIDELLARPVHEQDDLRLELLN